MPAAEPETLDFRIPAVLTDFLLDPSDIRLIFGPRAELKTTSSYQAWILEAEASPPAARPYRVIVVRDTLVNLQRTTMDTLRELQSRGLRVQWRDAGGHHEASVEGGLLLFFFLGMDHLKDLNKFQGFGAGGLWIEEPAPAAVNDIGTGLPAEVLGVGFTSLRQPGVRHRAIISMNPPDQDHWTLKLREGVEALHRKTGSPLTLREFRVPKGTNPWIADEDRQKWRAGLELIGRGDLVQRLSEGVPGFVVQGEVAFPEYAERTHVAPEPLEPLRRVPVVRSLDFGLTPVCVFSQVTPQGHWHLLDAVAGENMGLEELIEIHALPWLRRYLGDLREWQFRDIGGPEALVKEQGSGQEIVLSLQKGFGGAVSYEAGPVGWDDRILPMKRVLNRTIRGRGVVQVDPEARLLRRMFRGGAYYPKDSNGQVVRTKAAMARVSGIFDDLLDAVCHAAAVLFPIWAEKPAPPRRPKMGVPPEHAWMGR